MSLSIHRTLAMASSLAILAGCSSTVRWPNFFHPGPAGYQRHDAIYHDPYPLDDVGPKIEGGRPLEYQRPVPEVVRGRLAPPPAAIPQPVYPQTPAPSFPQ